MAERVISLAETLGTAPPPDLGPATEPDAAAPSAIAALDLTDPKAFALAILTSREFREYIIQNLILGELPAAITLRLMDHGWGKPPERVEHTGKDGGAIESVKIVRVIVDPRGEEIERAERTIAVGPAVH